MNTKIQGKFFSPFFCFFSMVNNSECLVTVKCKRCVFFFFLKYKDALVPYPASALLEEWVFEGFISGQEVLFSSE